LQESGYGWIVTATHMASSSSPASIQLRRDLISLLPDLRGFARFLVRDRAEADDLVQEAVVRALSKVDQFTAGTNLRAWLFTILRNAHYEHIRRRRTESRALEQSGLKENELASVPAQHSQAELNDLQRVLWRLPPLLREALVLVGAHGMGYEQAAQICAVPVGTMKARVSRARSQLSRIMDGQTRAAQDQSPGEATTELDA
jgi:RNA polymerase sigma-70 factor (ECF subfamily)